MTNQTEHKWVARLTHTIVGVGSLVAAAGIVWALVATQPLLKISDKEPTPPSVQVIRAMVVPVQRQWHGYGTAQAMDRADVPARVVTTVKTISNAIEPGVTVKKDQLLMTLDSSDFDRQVEIAQNNLREIDAQLKQLEVERKAATQLQILAKEDVKLTEAELQRSRKVYEQSAGSSQDMERTKRDLIASRRIEVTQQQVMQLIEHRQAALIARQSAQQSTWRLAKEDVQRCRIISPLDGVLESLDVEAGEHVTGGKRVARVVSLTRIEVVLRLPAAARSDVRPGDAVMLMATNGKKRTWPAKIARVGPTDDPSTRTVTIYVELKQDKKTSSHLISPGQFIEAVITAGVVKQRWVVPERALRGDRLSLVTAQRVVTRPVEVDFLIEKRFEQFGLEDDQWAALSTALSPGELIIVNPSQTTSEGRQVSPIIVGPGRTVEKNKPEHSG